MKSRRHLLLSLVAVIAVSGCASTKVSDRKILVNEKLPRPNRILVYDFVATATDVPTGSSLTGQYSAPPQTSEQIALGRQVGTEIATQLVEEIRAMGLPATRVVVGMRPEINDIVIRGYLVSIDEGSTVKRVTIGFGAGGSELKTLVEGYQMTSTGLRKLGSGTLESTGNKGPGASLGAIGMIATANPVGLIVSSGVKVYGEASGNAKISGRAKETAEEIAKQIKPRFEEQGWIE